MNGLSRAELERLALLAEECNEVGQAVSKILRHGYDECHPDRTTNNREELSYEVGNVLKVIDLLTTEQDLNTYYVERGKFQKEKNLLEYTYYQDFSEGLL